MTKQLWLWLERVEVKLLVWWGSLSPCCEEWMYDDGYDGERCSKCHKKH